jgi:sugar/nucleoside kinase (ribokinase family)
VRWIQQTMYDLITIGDTVIDTYLPIDDAEILEKDDIKYLGLKYGLKIPVEEGVSVVAGNAANNAIGASRLKLKTAIYTNVGNKDDEQDDDRIKAKLKKEGVDIRYVFETDELPSNHNIILSFKGERTILVHHQPYKFELPDLDKTKWVYLTSMAPNYIDTPVVNQLVNYLERSGAKLAYQPGTFQVKLGSKKQHRILSMTEFFVLNVEEAIHFLGHPEKNPVSIKDLLGQLQELGPKKVVITDGGKGSFGFDGEKYFQLECFPAKLVEMTGAGDAYATGTVAGLIQGLPLEEAMRWGAANSAAVVEQMGSTTGLLSLNKMEERLKENKKIIAKEI